jgi:hypothetical protein
MSTEKDPRRGVILKTNGEAHEVLPADGKAFSLEELQEAVGGLIELVRLTCGCNMFINEEGKLNGLEANHRASWLFWNSHPAAFDVGDFICGDAIITRDGECSE